MKRFVTFLLLVLSISQLYAQASGGQIVRKEKLSNKTTIKSNSVGTSVNSSKKVVSIQPIPIDSLNKYNVVIGSYGLLPNAQKLCNSLRDKGFVSNICFDSSFIMYRVLLFSGTNNEQDARLNRNKAREDYPNAWIMCIENGGIYKLE